MMRGLEKAPWWAWVVIVVGAVFLAVGVPIAVARDTKEPLSQAELDRMEAAASAADASASASTSEPDAPAIAFLGDSYTAGTTQYGGLGAAGYPAIVASRVGMTPVIAAEGGTGYLGDVNDKGVTFPDQVDAVVQANPQIVVIMGSRNDQDQVPQAVGDMAKSIYGELQQRLPGAKILVIGPIWPVGAVPSNLEAVNDAVHAAADTAGIPYVDALADGWLQNLPSGSIAADNSHPTDAGHQALADLVEQALRSNGLV